MDIITIALNTVVQKVGFSRLVPSGRGRGLLKEMLNKEDVRDFYQRIFSLDTGALRTLPETLSLHNSVTVTMVMKIPTSRQEAVQQAFQGLPFFLTGLWSHAEDVWFAMSWSLIAGAVVWVWFRAGIQSRTAQVFEIGSARGIAWVLLTTAVFIGVLSPALVRAERFIFVTYFLIGAVGAVAAIRSSDGFRRLAESSARHSWLPAALWLVTFLLSLGSRTLRL